MNDHSGTEESPTHAGPVLPLLRRFPALASIPRVALCDLPTPVEPLDALAPGLWMKRDDLSALPIGGNKARALEFLLGGVRPGDRVITVGGTGSTHALATALFAGRLGAHVVTPRWRQETNAAADAVAARIERAAEHARTHRTVAGTYVAAGAAFLRGRLAPSHAGRTWWIPAGGSTPLGVLGHVNAALELAGQVDAGLLPPPARVVLPLGSGGTAAGLALGFRIAGLRTLVVGARVVPRIVGTRRRVLRLADSTARLIERYTGGRTPLPRPGRDDVRVAHGAYGGAYGRELPAARAVAERLRSAGGPWLDATYGAKALLTALDLADGAPMVFWVTFDARWMDQMRESTDEGRGDGVRSPAIRDPDAESGRGEVSSPRREPRAESAVPPNPDPRESPRPSPLDPRSS